MTTTAHAASSGTTTTVLLPLDAISPGPNDRTATGFGEEAIGELAGSIERDGLAQPITVRPRGASLTGEARYEIVAGERRYRAHRWLAERRRGVLRGEGDGSAALVECIVRDWDDRRASATMLAENMARADLAPLEEANAYRSRMDAFGLDESEVAAWAGVSRFRVTTRLRLLALTPAAAALVRSGDLPVGHAARLHELDANRQALMLEAWAQSGGTIHAAGWSQLVGERLAEQSQESMFDAASFLQAATMAESVQAKEPSTKVLRRHLQHAVRAMEAAGIAGELCAEIRATWPRSWAIAETTKASTTP